MFIVSLGILFALVCLLEYSSLYLTQDELSYRSVTDVSVAFIISLLASYGMISLVAFKMVPIASLTKADFWLSLLVTAIVTGAIKTITYRKVFLATLQSTGKGHYIAVGLMIIVAVFVAELTLFNYRHFESINFKEHTVTHYTLGQGLEQKDGQKLVIREDGEKSITIDPISGYVHNLYINMTGEAEKPIKMTLQVRDEGIGVYYTLPSREIYQEIPQSQYLRLHLYGEARGIKILLNGPPGTEYTLSEIGFNKHVPFIFSYPRALVLQFVLILLYLVRPKSKLYAIVLDFKSKTQKWIVFGLICLQVLFFWQVVKLNPVFVEPPWMHHYQYHRLTESFVEGQVHLKEVPSEALLAMENPYDSSLRSENQVYALHDTAYYNGKYYVYFGVGPVLFFYLPYFLLAGEHLPTYLGIFIVGALTVCAVFALMGAIVRRWFPRTPFLLYLLLSFYFINGTGLFYIIKRPDYYGFAILLGLFFSLAGLALWILAYKDGRYSPWYLLAGSISMALVATCRPQMLMGSFLAIPIFWDAVIKDRTLLSKKSVGGSLCFVLPFIVVASGLMAYNAVRFGSVFDFGANYNLTVNDMTKRGWVFDRNLLGLYAYLIQPTTITNYFPFISTKGIYTSYQGFTVQENPIGGAVYNNLLMALSFLVYKFKPAFKRQFAPYIIAVMSLWFALVIIIADTQIAGIIMRYLTDYSWLLLLSASLIILATADFLKARRLSNLWKSLIVFCFVVSSVYHYLEILVDGGDSLMYNQPVLAATIGYLIQFWI